MRSGRATECASDVRSRLHTGPPHADTSVDARVRVTLPHDTSVFDADSQRTRLATPFPEAVIPDGKGEPTMFAELYTEMAQWIDK